MTHHLFPWFGLRFTLLLRRHRNGNLKLLRWEIAVGYPHTSGRRPTWTPSFGLNSKTTKPNRTEPLSQICKKKLFTLPQASPSFHLSTSFTFRWMCHAFFVFFHWICISLFIFSSHHLIHCFTSCVFASAYLSSPVEDFIRLRCGVCWQAFYRTFVGLFVASHVFAPQSEGTYIIIIFLALKGLSLSF